MSEDNWKHKSETLICCTCMWFMPKDRKIGRCKKHAPTLNGFPAVYATDWCGDHKIKDNGEDENE